MTVSFNVDKSDFRIIEQIADRAWQSNTIRKVVDHDHAKIGIHMDVSACHANGNPLRLDDLLAADEFNFVHDILGIYGHLDRDTGKLDGLFLPRFSKRILVAA